MGSAIGDHQLPKSKHDVRDGGNRLSVPASRPKPPFFRRLHGRVAQALRRPDHLARRDLAFHTDFHLDPDRLAHVEVGRRRVERGHHRRREGSLGRGRSYVLGYLAARRSVVKGRGPEEPGDEDFRVDGDGSFWIFLNLLGGFESPPRRGLPEKIAKRRGGSQDGDRPDIARRGDVEL